MTDIDTTVFRSLAERALLDPATWGPFLSGALHPDTVLALCDGYDEAARLREEVTSLRFAYEARLQSHDGLLRQREQANRNTAAARQALADFVADLRALCDERERLALTQEPGEWPVTLVHVLDIRAVIDRHAPATPTTEEDR